MKEISNIELSDWLEQKICEYSPMFKTPELKKLFDTGVRQLGPIYIKCTAASTHHHNFIGGLFLHTFEMLDILKTNYFENQVNCYKFNPKSRPDNRYYKFEEVAVGILYHDFGKIREYEHNMNEDGIFPIQYFYKAIGHIFYGAETIGKMCDRFGVSERQKESIQHIILSHHTKRMWQSAIAPMTAEAKMIGAIDLISSKWAAGKEDYTYEYFHNGLQIPNPEEVYNTKVVAQMNAGNECESIYWDIFNNNLFGEVREFVNAKLAEKAKREEETGIVEERPY